MTYREITKCRICGNSNLLTVLDLGIQTLTGIFPNPEENIEKAPVELIKCHGKGCCGLVQLKHSVDPDKMYGDNYGYRSGLNSSMVNHLKRISSYYEKLFNKGDVILDIGSNDGTLLNSYDKTKSFTLVGMDPTIKKFSKYYDSSVIKVPEFFSADSFRRYVTNRKAKFITSISMFYDLEDPQNFVNEISDILDTDGLWLVEQSYSLMMLVKSMYDTVVSEHLLYYSLKQIQWMLSKANMEIFDIDFNDINGGSFRIIACHKDSVWNSKTEKIRLVENQEKILGINDLDIYRNFKNNVEAHAKLFKELLYKLKGEGKSIYGLGASTKFNAILQFAGIDRSLIPAIGEVNSDKFGRETPGSRIPIISEKEVLKLKPDYLVVGPYHFRDFLLNLKHVRDFIEEGGSLIFPLPSIDIVTKKDL